MPDAWLKPVHVLSPIHTHGSGRAVGSFASCRHHPSSRFYNYTQSSGRVMWRAISGFKGSNPLPILCRMAELQGSSRVQRIFEVPPQLNACCPLCTSASGIDFLDISAPCLPQNNIQPSACRTETTVQSRLTIRLYAYPDALRVRDKNVRVEYLDFEPQRNRICSL